MRGPAHFLVDRSAGAQLDQHADRALAVHVVGDMFAGCGVDGYHRAPLEADVLADAGSKVADRLLHVLIRLLQGVLQGMHDQRPPQFHESIVAGDEVGLARQLEQGGAAVPNGCEDAPLVGRAADALGRRGKALLLQPALGRLQVAVRLDQRRLAVHHAGAGHGAQLLDRGCRDDRRSGSAHRSS